MSDLNTTIAQSRTAILERIAAAAKAGGRPADAVTLVAVSKQQPDARIGAMLATGQRVFGENRVQEAEARWAHRRADLPDLELRLIGPLQTNKAEAACALFDVIETLDRERLAAALAKAMAKTGRRPACMCRSILAARRKSPALIRPKPPPSSSAAGQSMVWRLKA